MKVDKMTFVTVLIMFFAGMSFSQTVIPVEAGAAPGADLTAALDYANSGAVPDIIIELVTDGGTYYLNESDSVDVPLTVRAADGLTNMPVIKPADGDTVRNFFTVYNDFTLQGIVLDGKRDDGTYNLTRAQLSVEPKHAELRVNVLVTDCVLKNVTDAGDLENDTKGNPIQTVTGALISLIKIENTTFLDFADEPILMQKVQDTPASVDSIIIRNCTFYNSNSSNKNQGQFTIKSDSDLETDDPGILLENLTFYNCGTAFAIRNCPGTKVRNIIIANVNSEAAGGTIGSIGNQGSVISHVDTFSVSGGTFNLEDFNAPGSVPAELDSATVYNLDPMFADAANGDFTVKNPALYTLGHDGGLLGDRRWADPEISAIIDHSVISGIPAAFSLSQNYPNPFNPVTTIRYALDHSSDISLKVYSISGELVEILYSGSKPAGEYSITWDASNLASGVYIYKLTSDVNVLTRKMMLIK